MFSVSPLLVSPTTNVNLVMHLSLVVNRLREQNYCFSSQTTSCSWKLLAWQLKNQMWLRHYELSLPPKRAHHRGIDILTLTGQTRSIFCTCIPSTNHKKLMRLKFETLCRQSYMQQWVDWLVGLLGLSAPELVRATEKINSSCFYNSFTIIMARQSLMFFLVSEMSFLYKTIAEHQ